MFKNIIPYVYTCEENIIEIVVRLLGIYLFFSVLDAIQIVEHGILKGLGKQKIASLFCLIIMYPINIPMAYTFAFVLGYGVYGLWYSQLVSVILLAISYSIIIYFNDWDEISRKAIAKFEKESKNLNA